MTLQQFFKDHNKVAVAFSGGVDSAYLLYAAKQYAEDVTAYYVQAAFQPTFELEDARRLQEAVGARMRILPADVLSDETIVSNPANRCYYCKQRIFHAIREAALEDGYDILLDGTNASDEAGDRPGMKALEELKVLSPLRFCGLGKSEIRERSKEAGLFTWNKPSYACLATRVPAGTRITKEILEATERGETRLFEMGFTDFRIRYLDGSARLQLPKEQLGLFVARREEILAVLKPDYKNVYLDLDTRT